MERRVYVRNIERCKCLEGGELPQAGVGDVIAASIGGGREVRQCKEDKDRKRQGSVDRSLTKSKGRFKIPKSDNEKAESKRVH